MLTGAATAATWGAVWLVGCSGGGPAQSEGGPTCASNECPATPPSWSGEVEAIVNAYCATPACHGAGGTAAPAVDLSSYAAVHGNFSRTLFAVSGCPPRMPPADASPPVAPLSEKAQQALLCWLEANAPDN